MARAIELLKDRWIEILLLTLAIGLSAPLTR
jgi:hypothetical protein